MENLDNTLKILETDYLDTWFICQPDYNLALEELVDTLEFALSTGRTRYVGLSNFPAWLSTQVHTYLSNKTQTKKYYLSADGIQLLQRGIEKEIVAGCQYNNIGIFAQFPLGRGILTGKYREGIPADSRGNTTHLYGFIELI